MKIFKFTVCHFVQYEDVAEKDDLMGAEDTPKRGFFSTRTTFKNRSTIFTLGSRDTVLTTELEDPIIIVPHAQKTEKKVSKYNVMFYVIRNWIHKLKSIIMGKSCDYT